MYPKFRQAKKKNLSFLYLIFFKESTGMSQDEFVKLFVLQELIDYMYHQSCVYFFNLQEGVGCSVDLHNNEPMNFQLAVVSAFTKLCCLTTFI